jgi:hypothetical protein
MRNKKHSILEYQEFKPDDPVKSRNSIKFVLPAKAGIRLFQGVLDPGFRRGDDPKDFLRDHQTWNFEFRIPHSTFPIQSSSARKIRWVWGLSRAR